MKNVLHLRESPVYPFSMTSNGTILAGRNCLLAGLTLVVAGCSTSRSARIGSSRVPPEPTPVEKATAAFSRGREAALAGDFQCAHDYFDRALDQIRPAAAAGTRDPELLAFSHELYEGILRYEALAAPPEETAAGDDQVAPELQRIESPSASVEAMSEARDKIASDVPGLSYDIPIVVNDAVLKIVATFQNDLKDVIARGLARSGRYISMIHRIFEAEGIPKDLAQVALIESSYLPHARSPMAAHGIWQFMPRTGRQYGLTANAVVDERSDPEKATRAAAKYLSYLHELFGDWYLAMAAYNAGEGRVLRAMERTGLSDFWTLAASGVLKPQTQNYVPAVIAATLIAKNPGHYGFEIEYESPLEYDTIRLDRPVLLRDLAEGRDLDLEDLKRLNPELRTGVTPRQPEGYELKIPIGSREAALVAFSEAPTARIPRPRRHVVKRGETLASVARRYRMPIATLASANSLSRSARLRKGRVLVIPDRGVRVAAKRQRGKAAVKVAGRAPSRRPAVRSYRVRGGDTLYQIARRHGTTVGVLMAANSLSSGSIKPGDRLKIPVRSR